MSGPKGVRYAVVSQREVERRERRSARGHLAVAEARWAALQQEVAAARARHGEAVRQPAGLPATPSRTATDLLQRAAVVTAACVAAEAALHQDVAAARAVALDARLAESAGADQARTAEALASARARVRSEQVRSEQASRLSPATPAGAAAGPARTGAVGGAAPAETAARLLRRLDAGVPADVREQLDQRAAEAGALEGFVAELALDSLREDVRRANDRQRARRAAEERAEPLDVRLRALEVVDPGPLLDRLAVLVETGDGTAARWEALERDVDAAEEAERAEHDRRAAAEALAEALAELRYQPQEEFSTLLVSEGRAFVQLPGGGPHAVRVVLPRAGGRLAFNVVRARGAAASGQDDVAAEHRWCSAFDELQELLEERGVEAVKDRHLAAGAVPVQQVESLPGFAVVSAPAAAAERERER